MGNSRWIDYRSDITDELTGEVHEEAKSHLLTYVNECSSKVIPTVYAHHSPDGSIHYLFGIPHQGLLKNPLEREAQLKYFTHGQEIEIFINYGKEYDAVR